MGLNPCARYIYIFIKNVNLIPSMSSLFKFNQILRAHIGMPDTRLTICCKIVN